MRRFTFFCALLGTAFASSVAHASTIYDFDSLTGSGGGGTALVPQDNWKSVSSNAVVRNDPAGFFSGASGNVVYGTGDRQLSRVNDANFSYSLTDGPFELSFKVRRHTGTAAFFGLGADADLNGTLGNASNEVGPQFFWQTGNFKIRAANQGTITSVASGLGTDNVGLELLLKVDPNANSGDGAGSFSWRVAGTAGAFTDVAGLQNIDLKLTDMAALFQTPSTWNGMYIRLQGGGALDDLTITQIQNLIPEPSTAVLAVFGLLGMVGWGRRRRKVRERA